MSQGIIIDNDYAKLIHDLKQTVRTAHLKAHRAVNTKLIRLYWQIGKALHDRQKVEQWGAKYLEQVSNDLANAFPSMKGLSRRNLELMRQFYSMFAGLEIAKQPVSQLAWGSVITLIQKLKNKEVISWYSQEAIKDVFIP